MISRWAAIAVVLVASVACSGDGEGEPRGLDPALLDYVYPTSGDADHAARLQFEVGIAQARGEGIADCLADRGYPGSYSLVVDDARDMAGVMGTLPPLSLIAEEGFASGPPPRTPDEFTEAMTVCRTTDTSKVTAWSERIRKLSFVGVKKTRSIIGAVEATPIWEKARSCMIEAGAPTEPDPVSGPSLSAHIWASTADHDLNAGGESAGPSPEVQAYVRCVRPFYDEVQRRLEKPRRDFVEKHREELLELQAEYATFAE